MARCTCRCRANPKSRRPCSIASRHSSRPGRFVPDSTSNLDRDQLIEHLRFAAELGVEGVSRDPAWRARTDDVVPAAEGAAVLRDSAVVVGDALEGVPPGGVRLPMLPAN